MPGDQKHNRCDPAQGFARQQMDEFLACQKIQHLSEYLSDLTGI
jgi:hypothetical protein